MRSTLCSEMSPRCPEPARPHSDHLRQPVDGAGEQVTLHVALEDCHVLVGVAVQRHLVALLDGLPAQVRVGHRGVRRHEPGRGQSPAPQDAQQPPRRDRGELTSRAGRRRGDAARQPRGQRVEVERQAHDTLAFTASSLHAIGRLALPAPVPPSTSTTEPVIQPASGEHRNAATAATSSGVPASWGEGRPASSPPRKPSTAG